MLMELGMFTLTLICWDLISINLLVTPLHPRLLPIHSLCVECVGPCLAQIPPFVSSSKFTHVNPTLDCALEYILHRTHTLQSPPTMQSYYLLGHNLCTCWSWDSKILAPKLKFPHSSHTYSTFEANDNLPLIGIHLCVDLFWGVVYTMLFSFQNCPFWAYLK